MPAPIFWSGLWMRRWRRSTLPPPREGSTIDADRLNDRVRDGNGCGPVALVASKVKDECVNSWCWRLTPSVWTAERSSLTGNYYGSAEALARLTPAAYQRGS